MPTIIKLIPNLESQKKIKKYIKENIEIIKEPNKNFHSTLVYTSQIPLFERKIISKKIDSKLPRIINAKRFYLDIFGKNELILRYEDEKIINLEKEILSFGMNQIINWDIIKNDYEKEILRKSLYKKPKVVYSKFNPHITISRNFSRKDLSKLTEFKYEIIFKNFIWENNYS